MTSDDNNASSDGNNSASSASASAPADVVVSDAGVSVATETPVNVDAPSVMTPAGVAHETATTPAPAPPAAANRIGWWVARGLVLIAVAAFVVVTFSYRYHNAWFDYAIQGDQRQSIGQYWRYARAGAMPPGHIFVDYAFAYHAPPLWWAIMATFSSVTGPLLAGKILGIVAVLLCVLGAAVVVAKRTDWVVGLAIAALLIRNPPDLPQQITGGMARSMGPALVYLFLWAFMERRHKWALLTLVIQAAVYPSIVIPCGIAYGLYCVIKGPMPVRLKNCAGMFVAGLLVIVLGKAQDFRSPEWWGDTVTYAEASEMPAWRAGGRFEEVPHRPFVDIMRSNLVRSFKELGARPVDPGTAQWAARHLVDVFLLLPLAVAAVFTGAGYLRRRSAPQGQPLGRYPWEPWFLGFATICAYWLVRWTSFKLFLPSRQIGYVIQYLVPTSLAMMVWYGVLALWPRQRALASVLAIGLCVVPAFVFRGDGLNTTSAGYTNHQGDALMWEKVRQLPLDQEIGCDVRYCEIMMTLGQHAPYAARNLTHPLRKGYYQETERRLVEMMRALHATTIEELEAFVAASNVHFFLYKKEETQAVSKRLFHPVSDKVRTIFFAGRGKARLLHRPPKEAVLAQRGDLVLVDLDRLIEVLRNPPASSEPVAP